MAWTSQNQLELLNAAFSTCNTIPFCDVVACSNVLADSF